MLLFAVCSSLTFGMARAADPASLITEFPIPMEGCWPQAITTGPDGNLWVVESHKCQVIRIAPDGKMTQFTVPNMKPLGSLQPLMQSIAAGADGNLWFTSPGENAIRRVSPKGEFNGEFAIPKVPVTATNKLGNAFPRGIAAAPDGNVWFAELFGNKIGRISAKGEITEFPIPTADSGPYEPAFDKSGNVWFCESTADKIGKLDPATGKFEEFPLPVAKCLPRDMITGSEGNLWFSENQADKIGRITPKGELTEFPVPKGSRPVGLAAGPDGNIWFSGFGTSKIGRLAPDGKVTMFDIATAKAQPFGLAAGPDGNIWFAAQSNRVGRLDVKAADKQ
jgi:virginiamycin B lyase